MLLSVGLITMGSITVVVFLLVLSYYLVKRLAPFIKHPLLATSPPSACTLVLNKLRSICSGDGAAEPPVIELPKPNISRHLRCPQAEGSILDVALYTCASTQQ